MSRSDGPGIVEALNNLLKKMGIFPDNFPVLTVGVGAALISLSLYYRYRQKAKAVAKKKAVKKKFVMPKWAIKKASELEPPKMTEEQIKQLHARKPPEIWDNVLFFPDIVKNRADSSTKQLVRYIQEARTSIYVCMYLCSNYTLSNAVRDKFDEGLIVHVVSEYDTWTAHNSKGIIELAKHGVDVRLNRNGFMMHNKFFIIDEEAVVTGSLNWTRQGVDSNNENVIVTIDPRIVSKYLQEFNKLFNQCKRWDLEIN